MAMGRLCLLAFLGAYGLMIVFNFDVLARPGKELGARVPDPEGMYLWRTLHETTIGQMAVIMSEAMDDTTMLETWLKINGVKAIMYDVVGTREPKVNAEQVARILAAAGGRSMYFDTDPATVSETYASGIPSLLVCQPFVVRPEWSTEKKMRGWDSLVEEIDRQALAKSEKNWRELE
jgi:hypothetical protein